MTRNIRKRTPEGAQWFGYDGLNVDYFKADSEGQIWFYNERGVWSVLLNFTVDDMTAKNGFHAIEIGKSQLNWFWIIYTAVAVAVFTYIYMGK
ncbi:hypothetical protein ZP9_00040 [Shewanella phage ZP9]|nr:hypothetical protein ZP9_00040 [Shewanella phage ZP9]